MVKLEDSSSALFLTVQLKHCKLSSIELCSLMRLDLKAYFGLTWISSNSRESTLEGRRKGYSSSTCTRKDSWELTRSSCGQSWNSTMSFNIFKNYFYCVGQIHTLETVALKSISQSRVSEKKQLVKEQGKKGILPVKDNLFVLGLAQPGFW